MFESSINLIGKTATAFTSLLTIIIAVFIIGFILYLKYTFCREHEKWEREKRAWEKKNKKRLNPKPDNNNWQCLLIEGAWGSGKTTHYKKYYQYIDNKPNIYISCFSASRSELIAQIIQQQFWCKLLTLNGLLAKLMESNWQMFMPKNRVVVFDDLERLHANQDNYLDLIGVIDYLKTTNKCQIILIYNISELETPIFNTYLERIVDNVEHVNKLSSLMSLFKDNVPAEKLDNEIIKKAINICENLYLQNKINNLRLIKTVITRLIADLEQQFEGINAWDSTRQNIYAETFSEKIVNYILIRHLFFKDYNLFMNAVNFSIHLRSEAELEKINQSLQSHELDIDVFGNGRFSNDINDIFRLDFKEADCFMFVFENLDKLLEISRPRRILDTSRRLIVEIESLGNRQNHELARLAGFFNSFKLSDESKRIEEFAQQIDQQSKLYTDTLQLIVDDVTRWKEYIQNKDNFFCQLLNGKEWIPKYIAGESSFTYPDLNEYLSLVVFLFYIKLDVAANHIIEEIKSIINNPKNFDLYKELFKGDLLNLKNVVVNYTYRKYFFWFCDRAECTMHIEQLSEIYDTFIVEINKVLEEKLNDRKI